MLAHESDKPLPEEAQQAHDAWLNAGGVIHAADINWPDSVDVIIDALSGTGLKNAPRDVARRFFLHKNAINFALSEGAKKTHSAQCKNERKECLLMLLLSRITFVESRQADSIFESYITM